MKQTLFTLSACKMILALSLVCSACQRQDPDPNEDWVPGEEWIDIRDGQAYATVQIGNQVWMAENFNFLPDSGSWVYENNMNYTSVYGRLYNWETALKACPDGWHLPLQEEWQELIDHLGGWEIAGGKLKEIGTGNWESPNVGATNSVGFSALPGGYMWNEHEFIDLGWYAHFWSSSKYSVDYVAVNTLSWLGASVIDNSLPNYRGYACSVRYIKN